MKKKVYLPPKITALKVEIESPICAGSVEFKGEYADVKISDQDFATLENNDQSANIIGGAGSQATSTTSFD